MAGASLQNLKVSRAEERHLGGVLRISEGVYRGLDYLPPLYTQWVREEESGAGSRRNFVLLAQEDGREQQQQQEPVPSSHFCCHYRKLSV